MAIEEEGEGIPQEQNPDPNDEMTEPQHEMGTTVRYLISLLGPYSPNAYSSKEIIQSKLLIFCMDL